MLCPVTPELSGSSARDRTGLTPVQVSQPSRPTLKQDILPLLTQHREKINGLCVALEQWKAFSNKNLVPIPSVSIQKLPQTSQPALCGQFWTRITQSMCLASYNAES